MLMDTGFLQVWNVVFGLLSRFPETTKYILQTQTIFFIPDVTYRRGSEVELKFSDTLGNISDFFGIHSIADLAGKCLSALVVGRHDTSTKCFKKRR